MHVFVSEVAAAAPGVRLRFAAKTDKDVRALREGLVDLEIGVLGATGPEVRIQTVVPGDRLHRRW